MSLHTQIHIRVQCRLHAFIITQHLLYIVHLFCLYILFLKIFVLFVVSVQSDA